MALFRREADRIIDDAHNAIACAEMRVMHSYTDAAKASALDELTEAQRYLARAIATRDAWDRTEHDDYEAYPDVPRTSQASLV
jgi:hypothetical protein